MESAMLSLKVSEDMIKEITSKHIQNAIVAGLGNAEEYMAAIIKVALHQKVSLSGNISSYSSDNKYDYLDVMLSKRVQEAADAAIKEYIAENAEKLKGALKKHLEKTATKDKLIEAFVNGAVNAFACSWRFQCNVSFESKD